MLKRIFKGMTSQRDDDRRAELYRGLIRHEARIGGRVFGPVAPNVRREFFCLDERTWVWHEEWQDDSGQTRYQTTRYDVRPDGILKSQAGRYQKVQPDEALRLRNAARLYRDAVRREMYAAVA